MSLLKRSGYPQFNTNASSQNQFYGTTFMSSVAGETVDEWSAFGISTVLGAVSLLADTCAAMPLRTFDIASGVKRIVPLPQVLSNPDSESNTYELIHQFVATMALHGNSYSLLTRDRKGEVNSILNLHPYQMQVMAGEGNTSRVYRHLGTVLDTENVMHQRWFTPPQSLVGISPLSQSRNLFGLALAMERHLSQYYGEGATPSSVLETTQKLSPQQLVQIKDTIDANHRRHRKPLVLSDGLTWKPIQTSAADQQMIQMREMLIRDIARIFRVPSHLILASGDNQTYANVEQQSLNFLTHTIQPWISRVEAALTKVLPKNIVVEFDTSSLLRADALSRAKVNMTNIAIGARTPNEVRLLEGYNEYVGGDIFNQSLMGKPTAGGELPSLGVDNANDTSAPIGSID